MTQLGPFDIASVCHEANRALQALLGETVSPAWVDLDVETRLSAVDGVVNAVGGTTPRESHYNWLVFKEAHGWTYGPAKDPEAKTHPCMVPYDALPAEQRIKDRLFIAITGALIATERACRVCGCTDDRACDPPCSWVEADLCSTCIPMAEEPQRFPWDDPTVPEPPDLEESR